MELVKQPVTEKEYWKAIEELGGYIFFYEHNLADGRMKSTPEIELALKKATETQKKLILGLERFGVIHPKDCPKREMNMKYPKAPDEKTWYWNWYDTMKERIIAEEHEGMICSACPFSEGLDRYRILRPMPPCSQAKNIISYWPPFPSTCTLIYCKNVKLRTLRYMIGKTHGPEALLRFNAKWDELVLKEGFPKKYMEMALPDDL